jgi:hypothetical protein
VTELVLIELDDADVLHVLVGRRSDADGRGADDVSDDTVLCLAPLFHRHEVGLERVDLGSCLGQLFLCLRQLEP